MEIAPFGVNRAEWAFFEKVCRNSMFFAHVPEMGSPDGQSGAVARPDWELGDRVSGVGCL